MSTETTNKKIKIDNGTTFGRTYTDKAIDAKLPTDLIASANKLSLGVGNSALGNGINLDGFTYDEATKTLKASGGSSGGEGGISVIELTDKNGTIDSTQLSEINANPQNFAFKYNGKILLFTSADSTTYQYCNNTTSSSDNNVMTTSTLLTITSSTGVYTIAENVHNVVANSIHPANGGDLTNIQVGSKVYSIPSGGGGGRTLSLYQYAVISNSIHINPGTYKKGQNIASGIVVLTDTDYGFSKVVCATNFMVGTEDGGWNFPKLNGVLLNVYVYSSIESDTKSKRYDIGVYATDALTVDKVVYTKLSYQVLGYK